MVHQRTLNKLLVIPKNSPTISNSISLALPVYNKMLFRKIKGLFAEDRVIQADLAPHPPGLIEVM